jgi:hypothetical protein
MAGFRVRPAEPLFDISPSPQTAVRDAGAQFALRYLIAEFLVPSGDLRDLEVEFGVPPEVMDLRAFGRLHGQRYAVNEALDAAIWHTCGPRLGEGRQAYVGRERPFVAGSWDLEGLAHRRAWRSSKQPL